jgi:hypothetical protein
VGQVRQGGLRRGGQGRHHCNGCEIAGWSSAAIAPPGRDLRAQVKAPRQCPGVRHRCTCRVPAANSPPLFVTTRHYDEAKAAWTGNGRRERDLALAAAPSARRPAGPFNSMTTGDTYAGPTPATAKVRAGDGAMTALTSPGPPITAPPMSILGAPAATRNRLTAPRVVRRPSGGCEPALPRATSSKSASRRRVCGGSPRRAGAWGINGRKVTQAGAVLPSSGPSRPPSCSYVSGTSSLPFAGTCVYGDRSSRGGEEGMHSLVSGECTPGACTASRVGSLRREGP